LARVGWGGRGGGGGGGGWVHRGGGGGGGTRKRRLDEKNKHVTKRGNYQPWGWAWLMGPQSGHSREPPKTKRGNRAKQEGVGISPSGKRRKGGAEVNKIQTRPGHTT